MICIGFTGTTPTQAPLCSPSTQLHDITPSLPATRSSSWSLPNCKTGAGAVAQQGPTARSGTSTPEPPRENVSGVEFGFRVKHIALPSVLSNPLPCCSSPCLWNHSTIQGPSWWPEGCRLLWRGRHTVVEVNVNDLQESAGPKTDCGVGISRPCRVSPVTPLSNRPNCVRGAGGVSAQRRQVPLSHAAHHALLLGVSTANPSGSYTAPCRQ